MQTFRRWIGLDVGENATQLCALNNDGTAELELSIPTSAHAIISALDALQPPGAEVIAMEAGVGRRLARELRERGYVVRVIEARKASRFLSIRFHKTDRNDARGIAELAMTRLGARLDVHVKSLEIQNLRSQLVMRNQILKQKNSIHNALRSLLVEHGLLTKMPPSSKLREAVEKLVQDYADRSSIDLGNEILPALAIWEAMQIYISSIDRRLKKMATGHPVMSKLLEVPGVGSICAVSFYTAIEDPHRFSRCADVGAYLGLVPKVRQSGAMIQRARITKAGNRLTRAHLVMAARVVISTARVECELTEWGRKLAERVGYSKAQVAVARKLAVVLLSLWRSGRSYVPYPNLLLPP